MHFFSFSFIHQNLQEFFKLGQLDENRAETAANLTFININVTEQLENGAERSHTGLLHLQTADCIITVAM